MDMSMSTKITTLMRKLGMKPNLLGWRYINSAVGMVIEDPMAIDGVTKVLYPTIAKIHNTTASRVERAIRHSIECAFSHAPINVLSAVFGNSIDTYRGHATNSEFIAAIAQVVAHEPGNPVWNM
jgi:two-component system response regulator (stage 0 sporulation protein A)